jgi:hypothetical protein
MGRKMASAALPPSDLYKRDYYTWIREQVRALRERRVEDLDWPNLAEEIEDLEKNEKRLLRHQISLLLGYLLKRAYAPTKMLRARGREWEISVRQARHHIASLLKESPGLLSRIDEIFAQAYESGRDNALFVAELPDSAIPETPPWTFEQVIDDRFVPKPQS